MNGFLNSVISSEAWKIIIPYVPTILFYIIVISGAYFVQRIITNYFKKIEIEYGSKYGVKFNIVFVKTFIYIITGFVLFVNLPGISKEAINIISLIFGVIIAFSSTSIISNAMSGFMILLMKPYKIGDIVKLSEHFGEVAEIKLIYTLIETDKRELITIPNSKIINDVLINYSKDEHIVSSKIRIEYKIDRYTVEKHLLTAAIQIGLKKPFVLINKLNKHHIEYEIRGILENVGEIITIRSDLKKAIIDEFDNAKIQIMSPDKLSVRLDKSGRKDIPDIKIKKVNKRKIEKEAFDQEREMFHRAEQIKEELKKSGQL